MGSATTSSAEPEQCVLPEQPEAPEDILDISLPNLFDIAPIAYSTPNAESLYTYTPPGPSTLSPVSLRLPSPSAEVYTKLQANHVWLASIYLADLIATGQIAVENLRVAELGAAAGLPGIIACTAGARVVGSDWGDQGIIAALTDNFTRNCEGRQWAVRAHEWGTDPVTLLQAITTDTQERFDMLLLSDTLWVTEAHQQLLDSVFALLHPGGVAQVVAGLHTGRGPLERFISAAKGRGGSIKPEKEVRWRSDGGWDENDVKGRGLEEERGVVVYFTLTVPT